MNGGPRGGTSAGSEETQFTVPRVPVSRSLPEAARTVGAARAVLRGSRRCSRLQRGRDHTRSTGARCSPADDSLPYRATLDLLPAGESPRSGADLGPPAHTLAATQPVDSGRTYPRDRTPRS